MKPVIIMLFLLGWILGSSTMVQAANPPRQNDFQVWTELKVAHPIGKSPWTFYWAMENRLNNDATNYYLINSTVGFDYKLKKWVKLGLFYRIEEVWNVSLENRIFPQAELSHSFGPIDFSSRNRFEIRIFSFDVYFRYRNRLKFSHLFDTKPVSFTPYVAEEFFYEPAKGGFNQNRLSIGNTFGFLQNKVGLDLYYMLRRDKVTDYGWTNRHVLGTSVSLKF